MPDQPAALRAWHAAVSSRDLGMLDSLLAPDVVFRSPAVFAPQEGKEITALYLAGAMAVLAPTLRYVGEWVAADSAVLEFEADLDGVYVQGVDMLRWNPAGQLTGITVMVRPRRALDKLIELMSRELAAAQDKAPGGS